MGLRNLNPLNFVANTLRISTTPATITKVISGPGPAYKGAAIRAAMPAPIELAAATKPWPVARSPSSVHSTNPA